MSPVQGRREEVRVPRRNRGEELKQGSAEGQRQLRDSQLTAYARLLARRKRFKDVTPNGSNEFTKTFLARANSGLQTQE